MQLCKQLDIPARQISGGKQIRTKILKSESLLSLLMSDLFPVG
jgi:hypothetical protein